MQRKIAIILLMTTVVLMPLISCSTGEIPQIGDKAPAFALKSIEGEDISLIDFQGKIVIIVFTSVNCKECETQMPYLVGAYQDAGEKPVVLDIYHMIYDPRLVKEYVENKKFTTFPSLPDPNNTVANAYGATRYPPTNFIIDRAGIIQYKKIGAFQSQQEIEDIVNSL